ERSHRRARRADGRHLWTLAGPVRGAARTRPQPIGGLQRNRGGSYAKSLPAYRRERHGLDVRQLFDDRPTRRAGLVQGFSRRKKAGFREALKQGRNRRQTPPRVGGEQSKRLPPAIGKGTERRRRQRNVASRQSNPRVAARTAGKEIR